MNFTASGVSLSNILIRMIFDLYINDLNKQLPVSGEVVQYADNKLLHCEYHDVSLALPILWKKVAQNIDSTASGVSLGNFLIRVIFDLYINDLNKQLPDSGEEVQYADNKLLLCEYHDVNQAFPNLRKNSQEYHKISDPILLNWLQEKNSAISGK